MERCLKASGAGRGGGAGAGAAAGDPEDEEAGSSGVELRCGAVVKKTFDVKGSLHHERRKRVL